VGTTAIQVQSLAAREASSSSGGTSKFAAPKTNNPTQPYSDKCFKCNKPGYQSH
jgi:hypothetical protein